MRMRWIAFSLIAAGITATPLATRAATSDADTIASAQSAAPSALRKNATVVAMTHGGKMRVVREGINGITRMPDNSSPSGPDPMCLDTNAMAWAPAML
ncbi:MAG: hypothetical protein NVSMB59_17370 [Vulcanimicrobiaceae bacterium]